MRPGRSGVVTESGRVEQLLTEAADDLLLMERGARPPLDSSELMVVCCVLTCLWDMLKRGEKKQNEDALFAAQTFMSEGPIRDALLVTLNAAPRLVLQCLDKSNIGVTGGEGGATTRAEGPAGSKPSETLGTERQQPQRRSTQKHWPVRRRHTKPAKSAKSASSNSVASGRELWQELNSAMLQTSVSQHSQLMARRELSGVALDTAALLVRVTVHAESAKTLLIAADFARRVMRTQILHCGSRRVAAAAGHAQRCLDEAAAAGWVGPVPGPDGKLDPAVRASCARQAAEAVGISEHNRVELLHAMQLLSTVASLAAKLCGSQPQPAFSAYLSELAAALQDSLLLEHVARALVLEMQLGRLACFAPDAEDGPEPETQPGPSLRDLLDSLGNALAELHEALEGCPAHAPAAEAALRGSLCGRCVSHLLTLLAVAALHRADGGSVYGLPPAAQRVTPVFTGFVEDEETGVQVLHMLSPRMLSAVLGLLGIPGRHSPPGPRASVDLLLRIGRVAVASAEMWTLEEDEDEEEEDEEENEDEDGSDWETASSGSSSSTCLSSGVFYFRDGAVFPKLTIARDGVADTLGKALRAADSLLAAAGGRGGGWAATAAEQRWRLAVAATRDVAACAQPEQLGGLGAALRVDLGAEPPASGALPPRPPPALAAALAGGLLGCLERLVRRAAEAPAGTEAALLSAALWASPGDSCSVILELLAYGEPSGAAALVASLAKAMRRLTPQLLGCLAAGLPPALAVFRACCDTLRRGLDWLGGAAPAAGGAAQARPPAGKQQQQLERLLSYAACEWLPLLSCVVQQAAAQRPVPGGACARRRLVAEGLLQIIACLLAWLGCMPAPEPVGPLGRCAGGSGSGAPVAPGGASIAGAVALRQLLVERAEAVALLGAVLRLAGRDTRLREAGRPAAADLPSLAPALRAAVTADPRRVRLAAVSAVVAMAEAASAARPSGCGQQQGRSPCPAEQGGAELCFWEPELLRAVAGDLRAAGRDAAAAGVDAVAEQVALWMLGSERDVADGPVAKAQPEADGSHPAVCQRFAPPAEATQPRVCANPACDNLAGDSEAGLPLKGCSRCGAVGYCCRECQTAHWRAGHKAACGGGKQSG